jgi:hypothetical protein
MTDDNSSHIQDGAQLVEEDGKFFVIKGNGEREEMPEDAWRALRKYRGEG